MTAPGNVTIRRATVADAEPLGRLHVDVWRDAYTGLMPQHILDDHRAGDRIERWRTILEQRDPAGAEATWVAAEGDRLVGFISIGPARDDDAVPATEIWSLYVRASHWSTGIGYALFRAVVGERAAYLWVLAGNDRAIGFYQRQGFVLDGAEFDADEGRHVRMTRG